MSGGERQAWPGTPFPLGAAWDGQGTNFSLFSEHKSGLAKVLAQNHQFLGVNNAIRATLAARSSI